MLRQDKSAQGLTTSTLILIALGVLILIGGTVFFLNVTEEGNNTLFACETQGGTCTLNTCTGDEIRVSIGECAEEGYVCCKGNS